MKNERLAEIEKLCCALVDKDVLPLIQKVLHKRASLYVAAAEDIYKEMEGRESQQNLSHARELLAEEFGRVGWHQASNDARRGDLDGTPTLRALIAALRANAGGVRD